MSRELIEKMARAHWEDNRQSYGSMITWEDATERDRCAARDSMTVAVALLSDPANITDEMVQAAKFTLRLSSYSDPFQHPDMLRLIIAAAFSEPS